MGDSSCSQVIQTDDTPPPLSTFRRNGVDLEITGANSLQVTPGWSIQGAIDAASPGDTVSVAPGTYHESITLKSGVNVIGSGFGSTFLQGIRSNSVVTANVVTNSRLEGFQITGCGTNTYDSGVFIWGGNLMVNNNPVTAAITSVRDSSGSVVPECGIIPVATPQENLQFEITAYHPSGFLHSYSLSSLYGRNRSGGYVTAEQYTGSHDSARPFWTGIGPATQITNALPALLSGTLTPWQTCAYQFHLVAYARTINGFGRIYGTSFDDHYFITLGETTGPCPGACPGDLNGDGRVDGVDLALFAARFGINCPPAGSTNTPAPTAVPALKH